LWDATFRGPTSQSGRGQHQLQYGKHGGGKWGRRPNEWRTNWRNWPSTKAKKDWTFKWKRRGPKYKLEGKVREDGEGIFLHLEYLIFGPYLFDLFGIIEEDFCMKNFLIRH
jgi:hypothetical protein